MGIVTGYLTNPALYKEDFKLKVEDFEKLDLEIRLFDEGLRRGNKIGPNGILLSGEVDLNSSDIITVMYGNKIPENLRGLTYDVSSSEGDEDFEVRRLKFGNFDSYFALRVNIEGGEQDRVLNFNKDYLIENEIGFRFVEPGYVVYEYLVNGIDFNSRFEESKRELLRERLRLNEREITIIQNLFQR